MKDEKKVIKLNWQPNRESKIPLSDQIIAYVKEHVQKGDWVGGDFLPPQRALAEHFNVNRSTVVTALSELTAMGILESQVGKGTMISNSSWSLLMSDTTPNWSNYIEQGFHKSNLPTIQAINTFEFEDDFIRLSTGEVSPDLMPHDMISTVMHKVADLKIPFNYLESLGLYELRLELSKYLKRYNLNVKPSEILIVSGSLQALQLISISLLGKNSSVFVEEESYVNSLKVFDFAGLKMQSVPTDTQGAIPWLIKKEQRDGQSILYTIPTFHNPTGRTMDTERRTELLEWCKKNRLPIIEDDAYRELYFGDLPPEPIKSMDQTGNVLYLGSVSKALAPGFRLGWVIGPEAIIERLGDVKMQTDYGASSISQWVMTHMLKEGYYGEHLKGLRLKLKNRSLHLIQLLEKHFKDIATWNIPNGGFYIWLKLNKPIFMESLFERAMKEKLLINPGYIYGFKKNNHIRLSYSYASEDEMTIGIEALANLIKNF